MSSSWETGGVATEGSVEEGALKFGFAKSAGEAAIVPIGWLGLVDSVATCLFEATIFGLVDP